MQSLIKFYCEHWFAILYNFLWFFNMLIASMYLHKYIAHGTIEFSRYVGLPMQAYVEGNMGANALGWMALHPIHHRNADKDGDIHSPWQFGFWTVVFGMFWLHKTAMKRYRAEIEEARQRYQETAFDRVLKKLVVPKINKPITSHGFMGLVTFVFVGWCCGHPWQAGLLWICQALTPILLFGLLNAMGHMGKTVHPKVGRACNLPAFLSIFFGGDYRHLDHHLGPHRYRNGWADIGGWIIEGLIKIRGASVPSKPPQPAIVA